VWPPPFLGPRRHTITSRPDRSPGTYEAQRSPLASEPAPPQCGHAAEEVVWDRRRPDHPAAQDAGGVIVLILAIVLRDLRVVLIGPWVTAVPVAGLIVVAAIGRSELGPVTLMIGSICVGLAIDDALHLLSTYQRRRSLARAIVECWKPCVGSSLAAIVCFALFTISPFEPTRQFGLMMSLATFLGMLTNQILLPALLSARQNRRHVPF
jgi:predicted exporter